MGNAGSALEASEDSILDDSSLPASPAGLDTEVTSTRSVTTLSSDDEDADDYYHDYQEDTIVCSSFFARKNDALLLQSSQQVPRKNTMKRSASTLCYPASSRESCSPSSLPRASSWTSFDEFSYTLEELNMHDGDVPTVESDLRPSLERGCRKFWIVTTAALPWMTGTAVNPLLRAAHLSRLNREYSVDGESTVSLVIPWLESAEERVQMYGSDWENKTEIDQDVYIRKWLSERAGLPLEADLEQGGIRIQ